MATPLEMSKSDSSYWDVIKRNSGHRLSNPVALPPESERVTATFLEGGDRVDLRLEKVGGAWQWFYVSGGPVSEEYATAQQAVNWAGKALDGFKMTAKENPASTVVQTIASQLKASGLPLTSVALVAWDDDTLKVSKGLRGALIRYNHGTDLYDVTPYDASGPGSRSPLMSARGAQDPGAGVVWGDEIEGVGVEELAQTVAPYLKVKPNPNFPMRVERFTPRFIAVEDIAELANIWQTSRVHSSNTHERMLYTAKWFAKSHPEVTSTAVYKDLDAWLAWSRMGNPGGDRKRKLEFLWKETPKSYRSGRGTGRMIQVRGDAGSELVPLDSLTDEEIDTALGLGVGESRVGNPAGSWFYFRSVTGKHSENAQYMTMREALKHAQDAANYIGEGMEIHKSKELGGKSRYQRTMWPRASNPADEAAAKYAEFHGRQPRETLEIHEEVHTHSHLAALGALTRIKVNLEAGGRATIDFAAGDAEDERPILATSEDGKQLYIRGGDQSLDLSAMGMDGREWKRDSMCIGEITNIEYQTEKGFDNFDLITYFHKLGEETKVRPYLIYDSVNQLLSIVGGQYEVKPEGIVN